MDSLVIFIEFWGNVKHQSRIFQIQSFLVNILTYLTFIMPLLWNQVLLSEHLISPLVSIEVNVVLSFVSPYCMCVCCLLEFGFWLFLLFFLSYRKFWYWRTTDDTRRSDIDCRNKWGNFL